MQFNPVSRNGSLARRALVAFSSNLVIFVIVWIGVFYNVGGSGFAFTILDATADNREKIHCIFGIARYSDARPLAARPAGWRPVTSAGY